MGTDPGNEYVLLAFISVDAQKLQISEAKPGTGVQDRVLTDESSSFKTGDKVYLWIKISGGSGNEITVTWKNGNETLETKLTVGGNPWRTWAYKTVRSAGQWLVTVTDEKGAVIKDLSFTVN